MRGGRRNAADGRRALARGAAAMITAALVAAAAGAATPESGGARYGGKVLGPGSRDADAPGEYVALLQADLYRLGYAFYLDKDGPTPGVYSPGTEAAVHAFQKDYGLPATGVVNATTADAIAAALAGAPATGGGPPPVLTELETHKLVLKAGKGVGTVTIKPAKGTTYVIAAEGEVVQIAVINPYGAYAAVKKPPADVRQVLKDKCGDPDLAVIFDGADHPGNYEVEVTALNDLKDIPATVCVYVLTREGDAGTP